MFATSLLKRLQSINLNSSLGSKKCYSDVKNPLLNILFLGGGLEKMQGGIKEEEYFNSINQELMSNLKKHIECSKAADYLRKWEKYQKTLDQHDLYNTTCLNKNKDIHEEAFFMSESTDCFKLLMERAKIHDETEDDSDAN